MINSNNKSCLHFNKQNLYIYTYATYLYIFVTCNIEALRFFINFVFVFFLIVSDKRDNLMILLF